MYCIYQKDEDSNEKIIAILSDKKHFLNIVKQNIPNKYNYEFIDSSMIKNFGVGFYLLIDNMKIELVQKNRKKYDGNVMCGYYYVIESLIIWKLLSLENKMEQYNI
jgi:hypothetical protein